MNEPVPYPARPLDGEHGLHNPTVSTPPRRPASVRRTSSVEMTHPHGFSGHLVLDGRARDLVTTSSGSVGPVADATVEALVEYVDDEVLTAVSSSPSVAELQQLVGVSIRRGFRAAMDAAAPGLAVSDSLVHTLVDELPVAALIASYSLKYADAPLRRRPPRAGVCAGFVEDGLIMTRFASKGYTPLVTGPVAPDIEGHDPVAWHRMEPLPLHGMRRRRRLDVWRSDGVLVAAAFLRDSHVGWRGVETVVHEYELSATIDPSDLTILDVVVRPRVLPWHECSNAAPSARRLIGRCVRGLRQVVSNDFSGVSTCTHLNDQMRKLEDVAAMVLLLP